MGLGIAKRGGGEEFRPWPLGATLPLPLSLGRFGFLGGWAVAKLGAGARAACEPPEGPLVTCVLCVYCTGGTGCCLFAGLAGLFERQAMCPPVTATAVAVGAALDALSSLMVKRSVIFTASAGSSVAGAFPLALEDFLIPVDSQLLPKHILNLSIRVDGSEISE